MSTRIHVAVGVIVSPDKKQVLISKRTARQHLAGLWEFPGGKVEKDEGVATALNRELNEELGILVTKAKQLTTVSYDYPEKEVLLDVWKIDEWYGEPEAKENQGLAWVEIDKLSLYDFPEANKHIIQTLSLNSVYLISQQSYKNLNDFIATVEQYFLSGLKQFQLRLDSKQEPEYSELVNKLSESAKRNNAKLILNGFLADIERFNISGVHLKSKELFQFNKRPVSQEYLLGASCHNENELMQAEKLNVNYAFVSPVCRTSSHPEKEALGWENFKKLSEKVKFPVYALGGLNLDSLETAKSYNAYGIAMISAIWNSNETINKRFFSVD